jgi:hypothetical protein
VVGYGASAGETVHSRRDGADPGGRSTWSLEVRMRAFATIFRQLSSDLASELRATGRTDLARELEACAVRRVSFDSEADAGAVALEPMRKLNVVERNVIGEKLGQVISFSGPSYASLQLDNFGRVIAIDISGPPPYLAALLRLTSNSRWSRP